MPVLECRRCGSRVTVPERELKFGMDCLDCGSKMGPARDRPAPPPLGGVGGMTLAEARLVFAGPVGVPAGLALMWFSGRIPLVGFLLFYLGVAVIVVGVLTVPAGVVTLVRHLTRGR